MHLVADVFGSALMRAAALLFLALDVAAVAVYIADTNIPVPIIVAAAWFCIAAGALFELARTKRELLSERRRTGSLPVGSDGWLISYATEPEQLICGEVARTTHGAIATAQIRWPDGSSGILQATEFDRATGAIDAYTITYERLGRPVKTIVQPPVRRDPIHGGYSHRPGMIVT